MGWQIVSSGKRLGLWSIAARDENAGLAVGDAGTIPRTTDGSDRWKALRAGEGGSFLTPLDRINKAMNVVHQRTGGGFVLFGVTVTGPDVCWAVGTGSLILKTEDSGANWKGQESPILLDLVSVAGVSREAAWACGARGTVIRTVDGGDA